MPSLQSLTQRQRSEIEDLLVKSCKRSDPVIGTVLTLDGDEIVSKRKVILVDRTDAYGKWLAGQLTRRKNELTVYFGECDAVQVLHVSDITDQVLLEWLTLSGEPVPARFTRYVDREGKSVDVYPVSDVTVDDTPLAHNEL